MSRAPLTNWRRPSLRPRCVVSWGKWADSQNNLHELVAPRTRDIERQVVNAEELSERVAVSSTNLDEVELEFDANQPKVRCNGPAIVDGRTFPRFLTF